MDYNNVHNNVSVIVNLGDVGGFMGLLLGGSALTVFELMDLILFNFIKKLVAKRSVLPPKVANCCTFIKHLIFIIPFEIK